MRRFKDGSILESVVFSSDGSFEDRAYVLQKMMTFLIKRHMGVALQEGKSYISNPFFQLLKAPGIDLETQKSFGMVTEAFALLSKQLRSLKELPLGVASVKMSHPGLYFCSAIVPQSHPDEHTFNNGYRPYIESMDVVIELEKSGHWPDNLFKIQQMKIAFYLKMAQNLTTLYPGTVCRVSVGERDNIMSCGWIDVTISPGFKFRCRIHSEREKHLLDQEKESDTSLSKAMYERIYVHSPIHSSKLYNLCLTYPFLPVTIRIMKRWIGVHMLSNHVSDQIIELLCAFIFIRTGTLAAPGSSWCALFRVWNLLATHDWKLEPLIIELKRGEMTEDLRNRILSKFKSFKTGSMFLATEDDPEAVLYPRIQPIIINRLKALSSSCIKIMDRFPSQHNLIRVIC
jgi:U3 small nucleolar RNA-associated protein 22